MANASIIYERTVELPNPEVEGETVLHVVTVDMSHWPPTTYLVHLDEPLSRYSPEDGTLIAQYEYIALTCKDSNPRAAYVFPSDAEGGFVDENMVPMRTRDYGLPHSVLAQLGYTLIS